MCPQNSFSDGQANFVLDDTVVLFVFVVGAGVGDEELILDVDELLGVFDEGDVGFVDAVLDFEEAHGPFGGGTEGLHLDVVVEEGVELVLLYYLETLEF